MGNLNSNEVIQYSFKAGFQASQDECSVEQDELLGQLFVELGIDNLFVADVKNLEVSKIVESLTKIFKTKGVSRFLSIVLRPHTDLPDMTPAVWQNNYIAKLKTSEVKKVVEDFFDLNPSLIGGLKTIANALVSQIQRLMSSILEKNSSHTSTPS